MKKYWEDILLYITFLALLVFIAVYFREAREFVFAEIRQKQSESAPADSLESIMLKGNSLKYEFANKVLVSNSTRTNISMMVGTLLCMIGGLFIVRKVRDKIEFNASADSVKGELKTTLPGVYIIALGALLLIVSVLSKDKYTINESPIEFEMLKEEMHRQHDSSRNSIPYPGAGTDNPYKPKASK
jgi:hypothetical protein